MEGGSYSVKKQSIIILTTNLPFILNKYTLLLWRRQQRVAAAHARLHQQLNRSQQKRWYYSGVFWGAQFTVIFLFVVLKTSWDRKQKCYSWLLLLLPCSPSLFVCTLHTVFRTKKNYRDSCCPCSFDLSATISTDAVSACASSSCEVSVKSFFSIFFFFFAALTNTVALTFIILVVSCCFRR